jgi:hypothetical protein
MVEVKALGSSGSAVPLVADHQAKNCGVVRW